MIRPALLTLALLAILLGLLRQPGQAAPHPAAALPADWQKGAVVLNYGPDPYRPATARQLDALRATGANWVAFAPIWYMATRTSTTIAPDPARASPSDESLRAAIRAAHGRGLRVMLKPYFDVKDLTWRAEIAPRDTAAWWASYQAFLDHYLSIAQEEGVEQVAIGTELISMTRSQWAAQWRTLIAQARTRYNGALTYSANWGKTASEYATIPWWDRLDYIGLSAYFPLSLKNSPGLDELVGGWTRFTDAYGATTNWQAQIAAVQARWGKPVLFTEIGFGSYANSPGRWDVNQTPGVDLETQRRAYEATLQVWSKIPWFKGIYWWYWETEPTAGGPGDRGETPYGKPAADVLTAWYGGTGVVPPTAAPAAPPPTAAPTTMPPPPTPGPQPPPDLRNPPVRYFPETGYSLRGDFLRYWTEQGGLDLFGYPITDEYPEINPSDGRTYTVQYVERERFELHPENGPQYRVLLGLLGVQVSGGRSDGPFAPVPPRTMPADGRYFPETGHTARGAFFQYWLTRGELPIFGYPISEEFPERNEADGRVYTVQYYQRARFEYHPENAGTPHEVQLGLLGRIVSGR